MTMLKEKIIEGRYTLEEIKPTIEKNKILFPISATCEFIEEDGRSFGYPVDDGWVTTIKYDFAMGALVDDTINLASNLKKPYAPSVGISAIDTYDFSDEELDLWKLGLDTNWAEDDYNNWLKKGLIDQGESKEQWIADQLENYHCWPSVWQQAYNNQRASLNEPSGSKEVILKNEELTLFIDDNNEYFFTTRYFDHGKITKADSKSAEQYIENFKTYESKMKTFRNRQKQLSENLKLLRTSAIS